MVGTTTHAGNGTPQIRVIEDTIEMGLIATFLVQKLGKPTLQEIGAAALAKCGARLPDKTLMRVLKGLAKRGFIAVENVQLDSGTTVKGFSMKTLAWKQPPEYAHISDLLPELLRTPEAEKLKSGFDAQEDKGDEKARRGNVIGEYRTYRVKIVSVDPWLGSQPPSPMASAVRKKFPTKLDSMLAKEEIEIESLWERDPTDGAFVLCNEILQAWMRTNILHRVDLPAARHAYLAFMPIKIPYGSVTTQQLTLPVQSQSGPAAPKTYEAIMPPVEMEMVVTAPVKGFLMPEQFKRALALAGMNPMRGISPARGRRFGRFLVTDFKIIGGPNKGDLDYLLDGVPEGIMAKYGDAARKVLDDSKGVETSRAVKAADIEGANLDAEDGE